MFQLIHRKRDFSAKLLMVFQEIIPAMRDDLHQFPTHVINERGDGILYVVTLPFHRGMDIHVTLLVQEAVGGLDAVSRHHSPSLSRIIFLPADIRGVVAYRPELLLFLAPYKAV